MAEETWILDGQRMHTTVQEPFQVDPFRKSTGVSEWGRHDVDRLTFMPPPQDGPDEEMSKIFEDIEFNRRQSERQALKSAMDDVKELVDDDLEF